MKCIIKYSVFDENLDQIDGYLYNWQDFERKTHPKLVSIDPDKQYLDVIYKVIIEEDDEVWTKVAYCKLNRLYKSVKNAVERIIINGTVPYLQ